MKEVSNNKQSSSRYFMDLIQVPRIENLVPLESEKIIKRNILTHILVGNFSGPYAGLCT